jgi:hypothetical protein
MTDGALADIAVGAATSIEEVGSRIEDVFAKVGGDLGQAHTIFEQLARDLGSASHELSGANIDGASVALQDIAGRLSGLAEVLPSESRLLGAIGSSAVQASALLRHLIKHIQMIRVIARSSRIEAAALDGNRGDFIGFTQEVSNLAHSAQILIVGCSKDQEQLSDALEVALSRQLEFEKRYRHQLVSVSDDLISVYSEIKDRQAKSAQLAELARASTIRMGATVGGAIVSLQAGDSARQRLEHICRGLRIASGAKVCIGPGSSDAIPYAAPLICKLQAAQLRDVISEFEADISGIGHALMTLSVDSTKIVGHGRLLFGGRDDDMTSSLALMKQRLAQATVLISACGHAKKSVDASISILENMLGRFRTAIFTLDETIVDIILIGMNAALKAGRLGAQGRTLVVVADELKATTDHISGGAKLLRPVLEKMAQAADSLKGLRIEEDSLHVTDTENLIVGAIREIETGNGKLNQLTSRLMQESLQFEALTTGAQAMMSALSEKTAALPGIAVRLENIGQNIQDLSSDEARGVGDLFEEIYLQYTMEIEREIHLKHSDRFGIVHKTAVSVPHRADCEEVLFF